MFTLTVLALAVSAVLIVASIALMRRLSETEAELERAHERMARLDRLVEQYTTRDELAETTERPRERVDSAQLVAAVGLAADTDEVVDEEFAAPRMAAAVDNDEEIPVLEQPRSRLDTPVATPRNTLPPGAEASVLEVGSIQVRAEELKND